MPTEQDYQKWAKWYSLQNDLKNDPQLSECGECLTESAWQFPVPSALRKANCFLAMLQNRGFEPKMFYSESKIVECK
jgi:hypothetical protein